MCVPAAVELFSCIIFVWETHWVLLELAVELSALAQTDATSMSASIAWWTCKTDHFFLLKRTSFLALQMYQRVRIVLCKSTSEVSLLMMIDSLLDSILFKRKQRGVQRGFGREPNRPCKAAVKEQVRVIFKHFAGFTVFAYLGGQTSSSDPYSNSSSNQSPGKYPYSNSPIRLNLSAMI